MQARPLLLSLFLIFTYTAFAQTNADRIKEQLTKYAESIPRFKTFLHTDKPFYVPGDTLWYAGYVVAGPEHTPDPITGVLHVDLYRLADGKPVVQDIVPLKKGHAAGQITLPDSLLAGDYGLRAYTNFMRNMPEWTFFQRRIVLYNPGKVQAAPAVSATVPPGGTDPVQDKALAGYKPGVLADFQFFPEGGQLLGGVAGRLGFKAVDKAGQGVSVKGVILDAKGDTTVYLKSEYLGMGYAYATFKAGNTYEAHVNDCTQLLRFPVPTPVEKGYTIMVDNLSNKTNVKIFVNSTIPGGDPMLLLVHARGKVLAAADVPADKPSRLINLPRANFAKGINTVTLFDPTGRPVSERLIFAYDDQPLKVDIGTNKPNYKVKEAVEAEITVLNATGQPEQGQFSIAVTDVAQVLDDTLSDNLMSYLMLSSDIKGGIEAPATYFDPTNTKARLNLDILLQTQGWRQFDWADVLANRRDSIEHWIEPNLSIEGKIERFNKKPLTKPVNMTISLRPKNGNSQFYFAECPIGGRFRIDSLSFSDSAKLLIQTMVGSSKRDFNISIKQSESAQFVPAMFPRNAFTPPSGALQKALDDTDEWQALLKRMADSYILSTVDIKAKKKEEERDSRRMMYGDGASTLMVTPDMAASAGINPLQMLVGRVAGVQVNCSGLNCSVVIRGGSSINSSNEPVYMIDGVQVDKSTVETMNANDIESIDVIKNASMFGMNGANGAINFLTKRGNVNYTGTDEKAYGVNLFDLRGFREARRYYSPRYDLADSPASTRPDLRPTIYWNAEIVTDAQGKAKVSFYTNDKKGPFRMVLQGMSTKGQPVVVKRFLNL
jgi:TonB-dependent Receptor Plug Domain